MITCRIRLAGGLAAALFAVQPVAAQAAQPVAEARKLVRRLANSKSMKELPPLVTNETAAGMGILLGGMLILTGTMADAMTEAVEGMADAIGQGLDPATGSDNGSGAVGDGIVGEETGTKPTDQPNPPTASRPTSGARLDPKAAAQRARVKALTQQVERVFAKHGVPAKKPDTPLTPQERRRIVASGRALLADVIRIMEQAPQSQGKSGQGGFTLRQDIPLNKLKYRQISRTRVQITDPSSPRTQIEARLEGGAWRLHMNDAVSVLDGKGIQAIPAR